MEEIKTITYDKRDVVLFNSYSKVTEVLSNHHACELIVGGYTFNSAEQLFYCMLLSNYPIYQEAVYKCSNAKEAKRKGDYYLRRIGWNNDPDIEIHYLQFCQTVKYFQCKEFRTYLNSHPYDSFVEYAWWGDDFYGAVDENPELKYNWYEGNVIGKNVCGRIMMNVRDLYRKCPVFISDVPDGVMMFGKPLKMNNNEKEIRL